MGGREEGPVGLRFASILNNKGFEASIVLVYASVGELDVCPVKPFKTESEMVVSPRWRAATACLYGRY